MKRQYRLVHSYHMNQNTRSIWFNFVAMIVILSVLIISRCQKEPEQQADDTSWIQYLVMPADLHLPRSICDLVQSGERKSLFLPSPPLPVSIAPI